MRFVAMLVLAGVLCAGCLPETHDNAATKAEQTKAIVDGVRSALGSDVGKAVAGAVATLPIPGAAAVPVASEKVEWGLGILSGALALFAGWQRKKAEEERAKKKAYKAQCAPEELATANKAIYGDAFNPDLSK